MMFGVFGRRRAAPPAQHGLESGADRAVGRVPRIGDVFADLAFETTRGHIRVRDHAAGRWTFLFSHPWAPSRVCATEFGLLARLRGDLATLGVGVLGLSSAPVEEQGAWHRRVAAEYGAPVWFPTGSDPDGLFLRLFMAGRAERVVPSIRKSVILGPDLRIRTMFDYPPGVGRSIEETIRVIEALQTVDRTGGQTPADWYDGDSLIMEGPRACDGPHAASAGNVRRLRR
jgi:peroxiredoxin (alkyl hydroperoxide reductase subunit C)